MTPPRRLSYDMLHSVMKATLGLLAALLLGGAVAGCTLEEGAGEAIERVDPAEFPPDVDVVTIDGRRAAAALGRAQIYADDASGERFAPHAAPGSVPLPGYDPEALWPDHRPRSEYDPCACHTPACLQEWVDSNLGCDVCAVVVCGDDISHICNLCTRH